MTHGTKTTTQPTVLLLHCSSGSGQAWAAAAAHLGDVRALSPDLLGYGANPSWPRGRRLEPDAEFVALRPAIDNMARRFHLVGHSYGGAVALDVAQQLPERVASLTLIEPVAFPYVRAAGRLDDWDTIAAIATRCMELTAQCDDDAAAELFVGYWMGRSAWAMMPPPIKSAISRSMPKVAAEWALMFEAEADLSRLAELRIPTTLIVGERTRSTARAVVEVLAGAIRGAELRHIPGAGHMSPITHPIQAGAAVRSVLRPDLLHAA